MKILDTYEVKLSGSIDHHRDIRKREFHIQNDDLEISIVKMPDIDYLIKCFRWLSDNDALRHLKEITPNFQTNDHVIDEIRRLNHSMSDTKFREYSYASAYPMVGMPKIIPSRTWTAVWTFFSKQHAVMFKLAMGGEGDAE